MNGSVLHENNTELKYRFPSIIYWADCFRGKQYKISAKQYILTTYTFNHK